MRREAWNSGEPLATRQESLSHRRIMTMYRSEVIEEVWRIRDEYVK